MKAKNVLFILLLLISLTACVTRTETYTISPDFSVAEETLKDRIAAIIPSETIDFTSTHTEISDGTEFNTLNVQILTERLPANGLSFSKLADEIQETVSSGIRNIEDYNKVIIEVNLTEDDSEVKYNRSYKKEIDL